MSYCAILNACERKRHYSNKAVAEQEANRMGRVYKEFFTIYKCPCCREWHVAHHDNGNYYRRKSMRYALGFFL